MSTVLYIVIALLALLVMITIHEFGHYCAGKLLKFKIQEFSIGFGPVLYKKVNKKNGEIFYIKAIPLGGYCAFGEDDLDEKTAADPTAFNNQKPWKRLIVLAAGVVFNFLSAIIFSVVLLLIVGYNYTLKVNEFAPSDTANPAFTQTLQVDDEIIAVNGEQFTLIKSHSSIVAKYEGETVNVTVLRDGEKQVVAVKLHEYKYADANGVEQTAYGMGIVNSSMAYVKLNFFQALWKAVVFCFELAWMVLVILFQLITGQIAITKMGGTIATISVMADVMSQNLLNLLLLFPLISVNLAVFNILPIPALDGARMVFVGIEWARGKPVNRNLEAKIHTWGLICLFGLVVVMDLIYMFVNVFN